MTKTQPLTDPERRTVAGLRLTPTEQEADRNAAIYRREIGDGLIDLSRDIHRFLTTTIRATPEAQARKCAKEAAEFAANPSREEARDVLITLLGWYALSGVEIGTALDDASTKMVENIERIWEQQADGTWQHVDGVV